MNVEILTVLICKIDRYQIETDQKCMGLSNLASCFHCIYIYIYIQLLLT